MDKYTLLYLKWVTNKVLLGTQGTPLSVKWQPRWERSLGRAHGAQCLTFCDPKDCSLPGSSVHGISQARILEWVAISFSRGSFRPRDRTQVSCIAANSLPSEPPEDSGAE